MATTAVTSTDRLILSAAKDCDISGMIDFLPIVALDRDKAEVLAGRNNELNKFLEEVKKALRNNCEFRKRST